MQLVANVSIPNNLREFGEESFPPKSLVDNATLPLNRLELMRLKEMGIVTGKAYVYFALKLSYNTSTPSIDIESFCDDWQLTESELGGAIARELCGRSIPSANVASQLHKKGALAPVNRQLELELF
ncbi:hypothetical protein [Chroococcidiopsis sp.]|uniref:hypothetical protein n=1 Tax=Chroococcidiopsis sp. TaxID=3088168 RepID=UPI003F32F95E